MLEATLALDDDQREVAENVAKFAERHDTRRSVRESSAEHRAGALPDYWSHLVKTGLHAIHLPHSVGGQGGSLSDLAVVVGEAGRALLPGPLLPTVCASAVVSLAEPDGQATHVLRRLAAGTTAAVLMPQGSMRIVQLDGGWRLDGHSVAVAGAVSAELFVVGAHAEGSTSVEPRWFVLDRRSAGIEVEAADGVDLGRDLGVVRFVSVELRDAMRLDGLDARLVADLVCAFMAVEAAGVIAWCSDAATGYVKVREQFGRPVGAFQAVQHRAAQLRITSELATASAWDAVRGLADTPAQRTHAVAGAAIMALGQVVHAAVECLGMHGAIAFTWEHDVHLYWRRAIALAAFAGPVESWEAQLGGVALDGPRDFTLTLPDTDPDFRRWAAGVLDEAVALSNTCRSSMGDGDAVATGARRTLLAEHGMVAPSLPRPHGVAADPLQQLILQEEFDSRGLDHPSMAIGQWVLPVVLKHGTKAQIDELAGPTLRGEAIWCQLFSEPNAGSDVASLTLRASKTDGGWRFRGQKVWTTQAHLAHWGMCLARTGDEGSKHRGLSMFIISMKDPRLDVRPIKQANGAADFNEVFFDDVFVPDEMLLGTPGDGWALTIDTLAQERLFIGSYRETGNGSRIRRIIAAGEFSGTRGDALRTLGRVSARGAAIASMNVRETLRRLQGHEPGPASSIGKAAASMLHVEAAAAALNLIGPAGAFSETQCEAVFHELDIPTWVIGGGTMEIQLNTIASFVLALPRS